MFKSLLSSILRSLGATVVEKGSEALVKKLESKDGTDFAAPAKPRAKRKLAEIYVDELAKLQEMEMSLHAARPAAELRRFTQAYLTQKARVEMYKARLDSQSPAV